MQTKENKQASKLNNIKVLVKFKAATTHILTFSIKEFYFLAI